MEQLVTIAWYENSAAAGVVKNFLELKGITVFLNDENLGPETGSAVGYIKLQVRPSEAEKAVELLRRQEDTSGTGTGEINLPPACARCGSGRIVQVKPEMVLFLLSLPVLCAPLFLSGNGYRCRNCGYTWKEPVSGQRIALALFLFAASLLLWYLLFLYGGPGLSG